MENIFWRTYLMDSIPTNDVHNNFQIFNICGMVTLIQLSSGAPDVTWAWESLILVFCLCCFGGKQVVCCLSMCDNRTLGVGVGVGYFKHPY